MNRQDESTAVLGYQELRPFLVANPPTPGVCDLYLLGQPDISTLGALSATLCTICEGGAAEIRQLFVMAPPKECGPEDDQIRDAFVQASERLTSELATAGEARPLPVLTVVRPGSFELDALVAAFPKPSEASAVIVTYGSRYRDRTVRALLEAGQQREDVWSFHLASVAGSCVRLAKERKCYVLVEAGEECPIGSLSRERLLAVDDCAVVWAGRERSAATTVAALVPQWIARIGAGDIGGVIADIDALEIPEAAKARAKIQALSQAGVQTLAMNLLRAELMLDRTPEADVNLALARVAHRAREGQLARELVGKAATGLDDEEQLETALRIAVAWSDETNAAVLSGLLAARHPGSVALLDHRVALARKTQNYREIAHLLASATPQQSERSAFYYWLAHSLEGASDMTALATHAQQHYEAFGSDARIALARRAADMEDTDAAFTILLESQEERTLTSGEISTLMSVTESMLLSQAQGPHTKIQVTAVIAATARYLGAHPEDAAVRARLHSLASVDGSGSLGINAAVQAFNLRLSKEPALLPDVPRVGTPAGEEDIAGFMASVLKWIGITPFFAVGQMTFPRELLPKDFNPRIESGLAVLIQDAGEILVSDEDVAHLKHMTAIGTALAPHTSDPTLDLTLMRLAGGRLAISGLAQQARDLIEGTLEIAGPDPLRRRAAWFAYGDVYLRVGDKLEALLAFTNGLSCGVPVHATAAWYETQSLISLMRDLHVTSIARRLVQRAEAIMAMIGNETQYGHRLVTTRLNLDYEELCRQDPPDRVRFATLVDALAGNCRAVLAAGDEVVTSAMLLAQTLRIARKLAIAVPADGDALVAEAIGRLGEPLATRLRLVSALIPSIVDMQKAVEGLENARYASDVQHDIGNIALLARRFLDGPDAAADLEGAVFSLEILADQTIGDAGERARALPTKIKMPLALATRLSRSGIALVMLGLNAESRLCRATFLDGSQPEWTVEDEATFAISAFRTWERRYPYKYGFEHDEKEAFLHTMDGLGTGELPQQRTLLVMDTALQSLPVNLLKAGKDFAAAGRAVALAPSLTWLVQAERRRNRPAGPAKAWIPKVPSAAMFPALDIMAERLAPCFGTYGVTLETGAAIPDNLRGSEIAVVGAHGGVHQPDERYFRSLQDEEGDNSFEPRALAWALEDCKVVILFVCSGGRIDVGLNTTSGLVHRLLGQGCSTVIGSPWPLSTSVPPYWCAEFLSAWHKGVSVIDANAYANNAVREALGYKADLRYAMHVYGDPLVRKMP